MKKTLRSSTLSLNRIAVVLIMLIPGFLLSGTPGRAQIYEPEGINMPGSWNTWTNPPSNLALASSTQVTGGRVTKIATGTPRYQTNFSVAATGGDLTGGTYDWLFTSGSTSNYYQNKWAAVTIVMNTLQMYTKEGATNNNITLVNGKWYTMNFEDLGYVNTRAIFMATSAAPVTITTVSVPASVIANTAATINVGLSGAKSPEENIFIRYSADAWVTSTAIPVTVTGTSGSASIPGQPAGTVVSYYAFSTTLATVIADYDLVTIKLNNNNGTNYSYTVAAAPPAITWANLQYPENGNIQLGTAFDVFGRAYIAGVTGLPAPAPGLQAWVGYSTTNTDPSTWTNWIVAPYNAPVAGNDEFKANLGAAITSVGTYYYATRFKLNTGAYVYGGYSATGGGFWNGTSNVSGTLTVAVTPPPSITWANLQWPENGNIQLGTAFDVFGQAYIAGVTGLPTPAPGLLAWVGYSTTNTDPSTWTNWIVAPYNAPSGSNDEFKANLGAAITSAGTYYYATRFQLNAGTYVYGGFSATGGGFWNGTANVSGVLTITVNPPVTITWANLQWPEFGSISTGMDFDVFGQAYIAGVTGLPVPAPGLSAWVGHSTTNTDPSTWTEWIVAPYNAPANNNDEFKANLGASISVNGTYYYATRFKLDANPYVYGGFSATGGGFWDGVSNKSGILDVVTGIPEANGFGKMVYPNPTSGVLYLEPPVPATLLITDAVGKVMLQKEIPSGRRQIDISGFRNGAYHLQMITGDVTTHQTIIKR